jgi:fermentation-respiration switch protein FrsA (DUF1100 family)
LALRERTDSPFESGGEQCAAWLYPSEGDGPHPCVVMGHGFSSVREHRLDAYAERFAAAGVAVLVFDYRHFGSSGGEPRQLLNVGRQLDDWRAAVSHARNLPEVDPRRVAVWGSSFSGGHVVAIAAEDPAIAAVVSQAPFTTGISAIAAAGAGQAAKLTMAGLRDGLHAVLGRPPYYVPAVGPPGSVAVMTAPDAEPGFRALDPPEGSTWVNRVAGRMALTLGLYRPYAKFAKLRQPVLVVVCEADLTTPAKPAVRAAGKSPNAELVRYPIGHFEIYVQPQFERTATDQTEFLVRNLLGAPAPTPASTTS